MSDNEIYMLIKYIKSVLWRVAKRLSYVEDARCLKVNWKPEGRKKRGRPQITWKDGICTALSERDRRTGEWNNRRQWNMEVGRRRQTF